MSEPTPSPHPSAGPRHAAEAPEAASRAASKAASETGRHPRRWFLAGAGLTVLAAGGGVGAAYAWPSRSASPTAPPRELVAAIAAERTLLADLDATTGGTTSVRQVLVRARADHAAHLQALTALAAGYDTQPSAAVVAGAPRSAAFLRTAEQNAGTAAARRAAGLDDVRLATLLASIAACETTHAALLA